MPHWRQRRFAIGKKVELETEMLWESETLKPIPDDQIGSKPSSPISVASVFAGELQPLVLPGAWTVVGKGGKPVKKMYDEPKKADEGKNKKKKAKKARKVPVEDDAPLITLEEEPSSSKCMQTLERSIAARDKQVTRSHEAKFWAGYRQEKQLKREALAVLIAALERDKDDDKDDDDETAELKTQFKPAFSCKANGAKDKIRRRARSAAAAARCFLHDADEDAAVGFGHTGAEEEAAPRSRRPRSELDLYSGASLAGAMSDTTPTEVNLPGAWATVGKRGKRVPDFPPLKLSTKEVAKQPAPAMDTGLKRRTEGVAPPASEQQHKSAKHDKKKCVVM